MCATKILLNFVCEVNGEDSALTNALKQIGLGLMHVQLIC